jgi:hypothetical protein
MVGTATAEGETAGWREIQALFEFRSTNRNFCARDREDHLRTSRTSLPVGCTPMWNVTVFSTELRHH